MSNMEHPERSVNDYPTDNATERVNNSGPKPNGKDQRLARALESKTLKPAWELSERGFSVIPVVRGTKRAAVEWQPFQKERAPLTGLIRWFADDKHDLGVVTGSVSGVVVVDIEGHALDRQPALPPTLTATTPSGGRHYFFRYPGTEVRNGKLRDGADIIGDIRGDGGYVVAPPAPGREWLDPDAPLAELPVVLPLEEETGAAPHTEESPDPEDEEQSREGEREEYGDDPVAWGKAVERFAHRPNGDRHDTLLRLAKAARNAGVGKERAQRELRAACMANGLLSEDGEAQFEHDFEDGWGYGKEGPKVRASGIEVLGWDDATKDVPERWVRQGTIPWGISQIVGAKKNYKTFVALSELLEAAADGLKVVYIVAEGASGFRKRLRAWMHRHRKEAAKANIKVIYRPVAFTEAEAIEQLSEAIREFDPDVVVIDTLARNFGTGDESSTRDMNRFVAGCDKLRYALRPEDGCSIVIVHHTGHNEQGRGRGSSALPGAAEMASMVRKCKFDHGAVVKGYAEWQCTDMRDYEEFEPRYFRMEKSAEEDTLVAVPCSLLDLPGDVSFNEDDKPKKLPEGMPVNGQSVEEWEASFGTGKKARNDRYRLKKFARNHGWLETGGFWIDPKVRSGEGCFKEGKCNAA